MIESASCPICVRTTSDILSRKLRRGEGVVFYCSECDIGFLVSQMPMIAKVHYAGEYRKHASHRADGGQTNPQEIFDTYRHYQGDRLRLISPRLNRGLKDARVLEIGASAGQFISHLKAKSHARLCAIDLDPACCEFMGKMGIETDSNFLWQSRFFSDKFDIVCAFQTMEHVLDPVSFLQNIREVMARGAIAYVEVPNLRDALLSTWTVEEYRDFYFHSDHLFYFTERSLKKVATLAGFQEAKVLFSQDYNLVSTINWIVNRVPQATCHPGLSRISFKGKDAAMEKWLTASLNRLNDEYNDRLARSGTSSNMTLVLT